MSYIVCRATSVTLMYDILPTLLAEGVKHETLENIIFNLVMMSFKNVYLITQDG